MHLFINAVLHLNFENVKSDDRRHGVFPLHFVTDISLLLLVLLNTLQLATGATGLFSQGAKAVVYGCSIHALDPSGESVHCRRGVG